MLTSMTIKARLLMLGSAAILGIFITAGLSLQRLGAIEDQIAAWDVTDPNNMRRADTALRGRDRAATDGMNALVEGMEKDEKSRSSEDR